MFVIQKNEFSSFSFLLFLLMYSMWASLKILHTAALNLFCNRIPNWKECQRMCFYKAHTSNPWCPASLFVKCYNEDIKRFYWSASFRASSGRSVTVNRRSSTICELFLIKHHYRSVLNSCSHSLIIYIKKPYL